MQILLRSMICPDPAYRITAMQAYHHPALQPSAPNVILTPHFVRAAASFDEVEPMPPPHKDGKKSGEAKKRRTKKKDGKENQPRASTPTALGESIKQHTSVSKPKAVKSEGVRGVMEERTPSPKSSGKMVIKKTTRREEFLGEGREDKESEDPTREGISHCQGFY